MLCGIDEAGRGSLAGPLVIAGVALKKKIKGVNDSKAISQKQRNTLFNVIKQNSYYHIVFTNAQTIDKKGLSECFKSSILEIMENLQKYAHSFLIDGNTSFKINTLQHKIKADTSVPQVSAASILAKVSRDRHMQELALKYPNYDFEKHKGYGAKTHIEKIKKFGRCKEHRFSFKLKALGEKI